MTVRFCLLEPVYGNDILPNDAESQCIFPDIYVP
jgi:hypothetical protein